MNPDILAPIMFATTLALIFLGYPVAFTLAGVGLGFGVLGLSTGMFTLPYLFAMPERVLAILSNQVLLAIPFFIFMGTMLEKSRLAEDLLKTIGQVFGPIRGGLAFAVVLVGALLAAATGVIGASVVAMGMISLPVMLRYHYKPELSCGIIAASGTLGQIIPPSVVLVVLADQLSVSVGALFKGAVVPGLMLAGMFMVLVAVIAVFKPALAPALPSDQRTIKGRALAGRVLRALVPPLTLILVVLGSIFTGIATPSEAGSLGAVGAMVLAAANRRLNRETLRGTMGSTMQITCMVLFLLIGSTAFTLVFRGLEGDVWIEHLLANLPGGALGALIIVHLLIFLLGFFIDFFEIAFIVIPLVGPAFAAMIMDNPDAFRALLHLSETASVDQIRTVFMVWFGVLVAMNLQTSFLTPPFGFALFYLKGVCPPEVTTAHIYRGVLPFIALQLLALALVILFPAIITWSIRG